jgi:hypothetical protein
MDSAVRAARHMWTLFEPVHAITYFCPEARSAFEIAGLRGFWRGYFAGRSAPLGPVAAAPVVASFFNFAPAMVSRALPSVWDLVTPEQALATRQSGAVAALRRVAGASSKVPREQMQPLRGWTDDEWDAAVARLADRGLVTADGAATPAGAELSAEIEHRTDLASARPWQDLKFAAELAEAIAPISRACAAELPFPNPIGLPR